MAIIKSENISPEEHRMETIEKGILSEGDGAPVPCKRYFAPLVLVALRRANNPFLTGRKGFDAVGIEFDEQGQRVTSPADFVMLMMVKTAEVLTLFSCEREQLKAYALDSEKLESAAMDFMDEHLPDLESISRATLFVSERMTMLTKAQTKKSTEDEMPSAEPLEQDGKKKLAPIG